MPNVEDHDLAGLEAERSRLHAQLASVGDLRRGSLNEAYRRCGKGYCGCVRITLQSDHPFRSNPISCFGVFDHPVAEATGAAT